MYYELSLTNSPEKFLLDEEVFHFLNTGPAFTKIDLIHNIRKHRLGFAIFRKEWQEPDGSYFTETIYLHKLIADKYLPKRPKFQVLMFKNGNKLDCRLENLEYGYRRVSL